MGEAHADHNYEMLESDLLGSLSRDDFKKMVFDFLSGLCQVCSRSVDYSEYCRKGT